MDLNKLNKQVESCNNTEQLRQTHSLLKKYKKTIKNNKDLNKNVDKIISKYNSKINSLINSKNNIDLNKELNESIPFLLNLNFRGNYGSSFNNFKNLIFNKLINDRYKFCSTKIMTNELENFNNLHINNDHPSRKDHDTFFLSNNKILRTHTTVFQNKLNNYGKYFSLGPVFRVDSDKTHLPHFHQFDLVEIVKFKNFKSIDHFIKKALFLIAELTQYPIEKFKIRQNFFPFTCPSFEIDFITDKNEEIELLGCGIMQQSIVNKITNSNNEYIGFALGCGIERLFYIKNNLNNLKEIFD